MHCGRNRTLSLLFFNSIAKCPNSIAASKSCSSWSAQLLQLLLAGKNFNVEAQVRRCGDEPARALFAQSIHTTRSHKQGVCYFLSHRFCPISESGGYMYLCSLPLCIPEKIQMSYSNTSYCNTHKTSNAALRDHAFAALLATSPVYAL